MATAGYDYSYYKPLNGRKVPRQATDGKRAIRVARLGDYTSAAASAQTLSELTELEEMMQIMNCSQQCGGGRRIIRKSLGGD